MIHLRDHLRAEDVRAINRSLYRSDPDYLRSDVWAAPPADNLRHINNVRASDIQAAIDAVDAVSEDDIAPAWSQHMAFQCGLHFWPDGNHRTAILSFNLALERALGWHVGMAAHTGTDCVMKSKEARRATYHDLALAALINPAHAYRDLFRTFESHLEIREVGAGLLY